MDYSLTGYLISKDIIINFYLFIILISKLFREREIEQERERERETDKERER